MRIGVLSDTHGVVESWRKAMGLFEGADMIIHAGDVLYHPPRMMSVPGYELPELAALMNQCPIPIVIARGNCDSEVYEELLEFPVQSPYAFVQNGNVRIVVSHGHLIDRQGMIDLGKKMRAGIFISGHTHVPVLEDVGGLILMNPGSAAIPKFVKDGKPTASVGLIMDGMIRILALDDGETLFELAMI